VVGFLNNDNDEILKSQLRKIANCKKRLNALFEMRLNNEIDKDEYLQRKNNRSMNNLLRILITGQEHG
jgi:hypothetical protein